MTLPGPRVRVSLLTGAVYLFNIFEQVQKYNEKLFDSRRGAPQGAPLESPNKNGSARAERIFEPVTLPGIEPGLQP